MTQPATPLLSEPGSTRVLKIICILFCVLSTSCGRHRETSPSDSSATNQSAQATSGQDTNRTDNWHWDQAKADALKEKIGREHNFADIHAYEEMLSEKLLHEPPQVPLPNFASGPGLPQPMGMNFYLTDEHYPGYVECSYDVSEKQYDQANEPEWFKSAILQIRGTGPDRFPPVKWFAIVIFNRGEYKDKSTFEQCYKVGAIFKASEVFYPDSDPLQLITQAKLDRHPFSLGPQGEQNWPIMERHAATNRPTTGSN